MTRPLPCIRTTFRAGCRCTHTDPCEYGWIETKLIKDGREYDAVKPCPICRPDRLTTDDEIASNGNSEALPGRTQWLNRLQHNGAKKTRNQQQEDW